MNQSNIRTFRQQTPQLGLGVWVDSTAVIIGDAQIGDDSSVWPYTVIRGDINRIRIGQRCSVQDGSVLHTTRPGLLNVEGFALTIGDEVTIGHQVTLHGCTLGNRILVGMGSIVMDGADIQDQVILGAGSLVPPGNVLESGYLYVGRPAKKIRPLTEQEKDFLCQTATNYVNLKNEYASENDAR